MTPRRLRSKSIVPTCSSSTRMRAVTFDWTMLSSTAARFMLPCRATASRTRRSPYSMNASPPAEIIRPRHYSRASGSALQQVAEPGYPTIATALPIASYNSVSNPGPELSITPQLARSGDCPLWSLKRWRDRYPARRSFIVIRASQVPLISPSDYGYLNKSFFSSALNAQCPWLQDVRCLDVGSERRRGRGYLVSWPPPFTLRLAQQSL